MNGCKYFAIFQPRFQLGQNGEGGVDGNALISSYFIALELLIVCSILQLHAFYLELKRSYILPGP